MREMTQRRRRLSEAAEAYDEYRDEILELQDHDAQASYEEQRDFMARCAEEEARRRDAGLCPSCGLSRPAEVADDFDFTTTFLEPTF